MDNIRHTVQVVLGLEGNERGDELDIHCPVHTDRHASAGVNLTTGMFHCFTCGAGGDLTALVMAVKGVDRGTASRFVRSDTPEAAISALHRLTRGALSRFSKKNSKLVGLPGPYPAEPMGYLRSRGFEDETLRRYSVGYVAEETLENDGRPYSIRDYVAIPICDRNGVLVAYVYRAAAGQARRYYYTPGAPLSLVWFGQHLYQDADRIVVTEGALDSMWVAQSGFPCVAMMGSSPGKKSSRLLRYREVILFMDRDAAGSKATSALGRLLYGRVPCRVARYRGKGKDPAELSPEQVRESVDRAIPYQRWEGRKGGLLLDRR